MTNRSANPERKPASLKTGGSRQNTYTDHTSYIRLGVFLVAVICGFLHWIYVSNLHENHQFFSHLSTTERELTFRTEMGFYYSYFKQLVLAPNMTVGWNSLLVDTRSEFPRCLNFNHFDNTTMLHESSERQCPTLNVMQRFNIYPELILSIVYRVLHSFSLLPLECYRVSREIPSTPIALVVNPDKFSQAIRNESIPISADQTLRATEDSIISCVGMDEPIYFYVEIVFALAGLNLVGLSLSGWLLAHSGLKTGSEAKKQSSILSNQWLTIWGAVLPCLGYFYNHREATRVQWTPSLRESFSYPFFILQQAFLIYLLSCSKPRETSNAVSLTMFQSLIYCLLLLGFQLPWQFSQFTLSTQVASLLSACCLAVTMDRCTSVHKHLVRAVRSVVTVHLAALLLSYVLQFGNALLLTSAYFPCLIGAWLGLSVLLHYLPDNITTANATPEKRVNQVPTAATGGSDGLNRFWRCILLPFLVTMTTSFVIFALVNLGRGVEEHDGGHIIDLLREKLQPSKRFRTFHTRLYTCSPEFDFIGWTALEQPLWTGLLPVAFVLALLVICSTALRFFRAVCGSWVDSTSIADISEADALSTYWMRFLSLFVVIQLLFFTLMAGLIMRLKLFWTPQLCLTLALLAQPIRWHHAIQRVAHLWSRDRQKAVQCANSYCSLGHLFIVLLVALMTVQGKKNIKVEWDIRGQFRAFEDETLVDWFCSLPSPTDGPSKPWVISATISTQGSLRLMLPAARGYPSPQPLPPYDHTRPGFVFTNHPHYENAELRHRTILAYAIYSRKPVKEVWQIYRKQLQADFVIVDGVSCSPRRGCSNPELYDLVEPQRVNHSAFCTELYTTHVLDYARTPDVYRPYFDIVYVEPDTARVVLYVRKTPRL